ncbi:hypothetical protein HHK36_021977 [Tetracentron sinense]|uniref:LOB domain-containing protein n=1 Tax=Tetracentron sinense TaxID=13715 RepID=A0A835D5S2_TETSI|nr:hypothetical protein HHK36_021977 [Tetracentron sinense]
MASSSNSPCAACKFLRRRCPPECVFAPYFPPDQPQKFANVHKVFGASNVTRLLNELQPHQRDDAVNSLAYEADMRLRDPVYGCVGVISLLQHQLRQLQMDLCCAKSELSKYQNHLHYPNYHQFLSRDQQQEIRSYEANGPYDSSLVSRDISAGIGELNISSSIGQLGQFQLPRIADGDDGPSIDHS